MWSKMFVFEKCENLKQKSKKSEKTKQNKCDVNVCKQMWKN